ncbi:MAG: histone deacetylase family protein [Alphaproteobacteria bacterium]|nr:histone deacetylase family protein [Alphaproteobacteria bacterium]
MHIFTHSCCLKHTPPPDPSFAPKRLEVVYDALRRSPLPLVWHDNALPASREDLCLIHTSPYVDRVLTPLAPGETTLFAADTLATTGTAEATRYAAGVVLAATESIMNGAANGAFCLVSPGGHHAEADAAGGFCFFNNVALAAVAAQQRWGAERVAVVDIDAHHGNGTQSFFWNVEDRLYISVHEETPGSGLVEEIGAWNNVLNIPLPKKSDGRLVLDAFETKIAPKLTAFKPDILFVSAGFDAHKDDPLSSLRLTEDDYRQIGSRLRGLADSFCQGRLVSVLEGGYNLSVLGSSAAAYATGIERPS